MLFYTIIYHKMKFIFCYYNNYLVKKKLCHIGSKARQYGYPGFFRSDLYFNNPFFYCKTSFSLAVI